MNSISDAELVQLARDGDREAYSELIRRYQKSIHASVALLPVLHGIRISQLGRR